MMAKLAVYWIIGCVLLGMAMGQRSKECPNETTANATALTFVAVWPVILGGALVGFNPQAIACGAP